MTQQDTYIHAGPTAVRAVRSAKSSSFLTMGIDAKRMIPDHRNLRHRTETDIIDVLAECPWSASHGANPGGSEHRPGN